MYDTVLWLSLFSVSFCQSSIESDLGNHGSIPFGSFVLYKSKFQKSFLFFFPICYNGILFSTERIFMNCIHKLTQEFLNWVMDITNGAHFQSASISISFLYSSRQLRSKQIFVRFQFSQAQQQRIAPSTPTLFFFAFSKTNFHFYAFFCEIFSHHIAGFWPHYTAFQLKPN